MKRMKTDQPGAAGAAQNGVGARLHGMPLVGTARATCILGGSAWISAGARQVDSSSPVVLAGTYVCGSRLRDRSRALTRALS